MRAGSLLLAALALAGCGHRATIQQRDGAEVEGVIVGGDGQYVVVDPTSTSRRRLPRREALALIARDDIAAVDHPGDGERALGVVLLTLGSLEYLAAAGVSWLSFQGEYAEGPDPEAIVLLTLPALLSIAGGIALILDGGEVGEASRAAVHDPRARAYGLGQLSRMQASAPRPDPDAAVRARRAEAVTISAAFRTIALGIGDHLTPGAAVAVGLPLSDWVRIEAGVEIDNRSNRYGPALCTRVPLRLDVGVPLGGPDYAMRVQPDIGYAMVRTARLDGVDVRHTFTAGLGIAHRVAISRDLQIELAHGLSVIPGSDVRPPSTGAGSSPGSGDLLVDALYMRLGLRLAL